MLEHYWIVEETDDIGDILSTTEMDRVPARLLPDERLALVRDEGNEEEWVTDRQWAYVTNGQLPDEFDGGGKIPARFRTELRKLNNTK